MTQMKQNLYKFTDVWNVPVGIDKAEFAVLDMPKWKEWWPGLVKAKITDPNVNIVDTKIDATWKSMFGYRLGIRLTISEYEKGRSISFKSEGDLVGGGAWSFVPEGDGTRMDIVWNVETQKTWMNLGAFILRPVFVYAHGKLMDKGEGGFRRYLTK